MINEKLIMPLNNIEYYIHIQVYNILIIFVPYVLHNRKWTIIY